MTLIPVPNPKDFPASAALGKIAHNLSEVEAWGNRLSAGTVYYYQHITPRDMITAVVVVETTKKDE